MDEQELQGGAALAVEGERPQKALGHGEVKVGVRHDNGRVLGIQPQGGPQAVRLGMLFFQDIRHPAGADKGQDVNLARGHDGAHHLGAPAVHRVDHPGRQGLLKGRQKRVMEQHPQLRGFEDDGVAHDQGGNDRGVGFVEGVVEGPHAQDHSQGRPPDLAEDALFHDKAGRGAVQVLQGVDGGPACRPPCGQTPWPTPRKACRSPTSGS